MPCLFPPSHLLHKNKARHIVPPHNAFNDSPSFPFEDWFSALKTSRALLMPACDDKEPNAASHSHTLSLAHPANVPLCPHGEGREDKTWGPFKSRKQNMVRKTPERKMNIAAPLCEKKGRPLPLIANFIKSSLLNCRIVFCPLLNKSRK